MADEKVFTTTFTAEIGDVLSKLTNMVKGVLELAGTSTALASAMGLSDAALKSFTESLKKAETVAAQFDEALEGIGVGSKGMGSALQGTKDGVAGVAAETEKGTKRSAEYKAAMDELKSQYGTNAVAMRGLKTELNKLDDAFQQKALSEGLSSASSLKSYNYTNLAGQAINNYTAKSNLAIPAIQNVANAHKHLESELSLTEFKTTSLGKAFLTTSSKGTSYYEALLKGGEAYKVNTSNTDAYIKSLNEVQKHLQSIPASSVNAKAAQAELTDSLVLSRRAMDLMDGSIVKVKDGFEAISTKAQISGTVMGAYGQTLVNLNKEHGNLARGFQAYTESHKTNTVAVQQAGDRLQKYIGLVDQVKAKYKDTNEALVKSGDGFRIYGEKVNDSAKLAKQMQYDTGLLTATFYDQAQVQKVLTGQQELSVQALERVAVASSNNRKGIQELAKDYTGLTKGLADVGQYGEVYAESLKKTTASNFTEQASVEQAVAAHLKYAKTAEGLIAQSQVMTDTNIKKIKSSSDYTQNLEAGNAAIESAKANHLSLASALRSTQAIEAGLSREGGTLRDSMLNVANSMGVSVTQTDNLRSAASQLLPMQEKYRGVIEGLNEQISSGGMANETAKRQLDSHIQSVKAGEAAIRQQEEAIKQHNKTLKETPGLFTQIINTIERFAVFAVASAAIGAFTGAIYGTISTIVNFDQVLHSLKAITGATSVELAGMGDVIKETSASSRYSVDEIGRGLEIMGQAGLSASQSIQTIQSATNLATGTLEKMENVVDLLTSTMSAYNMSSLESGRISDILAVAVNKSKLSIDKLRTSLNYVGVIASQSGLSLEETTASLMLMADRGMKASTIGTGLRQVLDKLIAPNEKLREAYNAHGIALDKISPLTAGYEEAIKNLTTTLYDVDTGMVDTSKAFELFGIRGAQAATILIQAYASGEWKEAINSFTETGSAAKMAGEQMEGLGAKWDNFIAKIKVIAVSLGEGGLATVVKGTLSVFTMFTDIFQKFLSFNFGIFGYITSTILALTSVVAVATGAVALYTTIMASAATAGTFLNGVVLSLATSFKTMTIALADNPLGLLVFGIATLIVSLKVYSGYLDRVIEGHNKLSNEASQSTDVMKLFQDAIDQTKDDTEKFALNVDRLKSEYPELAKEVANASNAVNISTLSYEELSAAMAKVRDTKLSTAISESVAALTKLQETTDTEVNSTENLGIAFGIAEGEIVPLTENIEKIGTQMRATAEKFVNAGLAVQGSLEVQKQASLERLNIESTSNSKLKESYTQLEQLIIQSFDKQAVKLRQQSINYEKFVNEVSKFYKDLSIKQREEIQNMVYEEEKAVEKFGKFANDKNLNAEERDAELYAIHVKYGIKTLTALSEFSKKEFESDQESFNRKKGLIDQSIDYVRNEITEKSQLYESLAAKGDQRSKAEEEMMQRSYNKLKVLDEVYQDQIQKQKNTTFAYSKKLMTDIISEIKSHNDLEITLLEGFELEKLGIQSKTTQAAIAIKQKEMDFEQQVFEDMVSKGTATQAITDAFYAQKSKNIMELEALQKASIDNQLAQGKIWVDKNNEFWDQKIEYIRDSVATEQELVKFNYENQIDEAKRALDIELSLVDQKEQNSFRAEEKKNAIKKKYVDQELSALADLEEEQKALLDKEFAELVSATNKKFVTQIAYHEGLKQLNETKYKFTLDSEGRELQELQQFLDRKNGLYRNETENIKSEYEKQTQALLGQITKRGTTVEQDLITRGVALVRETELTTKELTNRGVSWVKYGDEVFKVLDKTLLDTKSITSSQTSIVEQGLNDRIITLRVHTDQSIQELDKQGIAWENINGTIFKTTTDTYSKIKSKLHNLTEDEKREFLVQEKNVLDSVNKELKLYQDMFAARKRLLSEAVVKEAEANNKVGELKKGLRTLDDQYNQDIRDNRRTTMTETQKYADTITAIEDHKTRAIRFGDKQALADHLSEIKSLPKVIENSNGEIVKDEKQMQKEREDLIEDHYTLARQFTQKEIADQKKVAQEQKSLAEEIKSSLEETQLKIESLGQLKLTIESSTFLATMETVMSGLDAVKTSIEDIKNNKPIVIDVAGAKERIGEVQSLIDQLSVKILTLKDMPITISIKGDKGVLIDDYLVLIKGVFDSFASWLLTSFKPVVPIDFKGKGVEGKETISDCIKGIKDQVKGLSDNLEENPPSIVSKFQSNVDGTVKTFKEGILEVSNGLETIKKPIESTETIKVVGLPDLSSAVTYHNNLYERRTHSYHTIHVTTVNEGGGGGGGGGGGEEASSESRTGGFIGYHLGGFIQYLKKGGIFSGKLPGFGGGDIVNARLEPGEFVLRKEAVKQIGVNALRNLNNLNSSALKGINPQSGSGSGSDSMFSGQLHTINLTIGNIVHKVYGDTDTLSNLTTSMRRMRLMTT